MTKPKQATTAPSRRMSSVTVGRIAPWLVALALSRCGAPDAPKTALDALADAQLAADAAQAAVLVEAASAPVCTPGEPIVTAIPSEVPEISMQCAQTCMARSCSLHRGFEAWGLQADGNEAARVFGQFHHCQNGSDYVSVDEVRTHVRLAFSGATTWAAVGCQKTTWNGSTLASGTPATAPYALSNANAVQLFSQGGGLLGTYQLPQSQYLVALVPCPAPNGACILAMDQKFGAPVMIRLNPMAKVLGQYPFGPATKVVAWQATQTGLAVVLTTFVSSPKPIAPQYRVELMDWMGVSTQPRTPAEWSGLWVGGFVPITDGWVATAHPASSASLAESRRLVRLTLDGKLVWDVSYWNAQFKRGPAGPFHHDPVSAVVDQDGSVRLVVIYQLGGFRGASLLRATEAGVAVVQSPLEPPAQIAATVKGAETGWRPEHVFWRPNGVYVVAVSPSMVTSVPSVQDTILGWYGKDGERLWGHNVGTGSLTSPTAAIDTAGHMLILRTTFGGGHDLCGAKPPWPAPPAALLRVDWTCKP